LVRIVDNWRRDDGIDIMMCDGGYARRY
jgi:hypothetical protein